MLDCIEQIKQKECYFKKQTKIISFKKVTVAATSWPPASWSLWLSLPPYFLFFTSFTMDLESLFKDARCTVPTSIPSEYGEVFSWRNFLLTNLILWRRLGWRRDAGEKTMCWREYLHVGIQRKGCVYDSLMTTTSRFKLILFICKQVHQLYSEVYDLSFDPDEISLYTRF